MELAPKQASAQPLDSSRRPHTCERAMSFVNMLRSKGHFGFDFTLKKEIWLRAAGRESIPYQLR